MSWAVGLGILAYAVGRAMWFSPIFQYGFFDYSLTSPHYFLVRMGWMTMILYGAFHWCRWLNSARWSPMRAFGRTSLLVYWIHLDIVYGPVTYFLKRTLDVGGVCMNLLWLIPAMIGVAEVRLRGLNEVMASVRLRLPSLRREGAVE
jgi:hypothetical protein